MAFMLLLAFFAAFGLFCMIWAALGWLVICREGWILCPGLPGKPGFVPVYLWLRGLGLVRCPLLVADFGMDEAERRYCEEKDIEICGPAELSARLRDWSEHN